jgi:capsular exopolysaccharide synthesis family protein
MREEIHINDTTLRDSFRILFRRKNIIFLSMLVVPLTLYVGFLINTPIYEAQVKMLVSGEQQAGAIYYKDLVSQRNTEISLTKAETVKSIPVLRMVVDALELDKLPVDYEKQFASPLKKILINVQSESLKDKLKQLDKTAQQKFLYSKAIQDLKKKISVDTIQNTNIFTIKVRDYDPETAATLANVITRAYMVVDLREQLSEMNLKYGERHPIIRQLTDNIRLIKNNLTEAPLENELQFRPATVKPVEPAMPPTNPVGPNKKIILLASVFIGLLVGLSLALFIDHADQTIKSPSELRKLLDLPVLGSIPQKKMWQSVLLRNTPKLFLRSNYVESYRLLSDQLRILIHNKEKRSILVTASEDQEGTSTVICNLAYYLSEYFGLKILVIDGNLRDPALHNLFHIKDSPGLIEFLTSDMEYYQVIQKINYNLSVISTGTISKKPAAVPNSAKIDILLQKAKSKFDMILIDSPNLKKYKDAIDMGTYADGILFLVSENKTRKHVIDAVLNPALKERFYFLGAVLNMRTYMIPNFIYSRL